ncbi:MAG: aminotransferase class V-fold PLP-dependent enzyme [Fibrobacteres bacterium]|nr:aminotransferase class V-fold PLP-dependent enzyme [Fibrobacterota bacterium]
MFRLRRDVYWDNNATTAPSKAVVREMVRVLEHVHGNPSSPHRAAHDARTVLERSRQTVARTIGADSAQIHFCGSATEATNQILRSVVASSGGVCRILSSPVEHHAVLRTLEAMAAEGVEVELLAVDERGLVREDSLVRALERPAHLVCILRVNNETGAIQDVARLAGVAHAHGALVFSDCVQALGKIPVDVRALGIDYAVVASHKIHGPKGIGALWAREGAPLVAQVHGGAQEGGLRAGTEALHDIAGFAEACRNLTKSIDQASMVASVMEQFLSGLRALFPEAVEAVPASLRVANTAMVRFPGVPNGVLMGWLDLRGIRVSAGSACATDEDLPSHVLMAQGWTPDQAREALRFSLDTTLPERVLRSQAEQVLGALKAYRDGKSSSMELLRGAEVAALLADPRTQVVDMRSAMDRKLIPPFPGAFLAGAHPWEKLPDLPRGRRLVVVCQAGFEAPVMAWRLKRAGHDPVSVVIGGMVACKMAGVVG